jgi:GntR family transcriptional regulator, transcriptional repressor for pyruvate dehydrogenase complex
VGAIESAINKLRDLIVSGQLSPGDRLLPEPELAALLGVSRNTLREAVRALIQAKVLDVRRGDGTYVTSLEPHLLLSGLSFVVDLMQDHTLVEIAEVRRILEPAATALAATRIDDATVEKVRTALERMQAATTTEALVAEDAEFHRLIFQAAGNATLEAMLSALVTQTTKARVWRAESRGGPKAITLVEHRRIVDALAERDPVLASAAATVLVSAADHWIRHLWDETVHEANATGSVPKLRPPAAARRTKGKQSSVNAGRRNGS